MERLSLIDVAAEDDFLSSSPCDRFINQISPGISENRLGNKSFQSVTVASEEGRDQNGTSKVTGQALQLSESPEKKQTKSGKCNLRKSLAWDNAFFTSEGVLDHEELAVMNSTFKKIEARPLPAILEDTRKSTESTSTLDNDNWELETLQVDLFENIRASIQKTHGTVGKAVKFSDPAKKIIPGSTKVEPSSHNKKVEPSSHNKKNSPGLSNHHREHTRREAAGAVNAGTDRITSSKILSKPPKVMPRVTPSAVPTKASLIPGNTKIRTSTMEMPVTEKSGGVSKKTTKGPYGIASKSSQYPKGLKSTSNMASNSADKTSKSPQQITRMKSTSRTTIRSSSGSIMNKASTRASVTKIVSKNRTPAMSPNSFAKSSTISPSSSFDSVASGSSSSTLITVKSSVDRIEASSSSPSLESADNDRVYSPGLRSYFNSEDRRDYSCRLDPTKNSPDSCAQVEPTRENNLESRPASSTGAKCYRPSGLKLPTPKIGYFDAKKSPVCNVKTSQTRQQLVFPRSTTEVSKTDSASKLKLSNIQHIAISSDSPKIQSVAPSHKQLVASNDLTGTTETDSEIHPNGEDLYPSKDSSVSQLPKPTTKAQDGDLHPKQAEAIPVEATVLLDNGCSPIRKQVEMASCGKQTDCQKNHHCDSSTINMEKENIIPAE